MQLYDLHSSTIPAVVLSYCRARMSLLVGTGLVSREAFESDDFA